MCIHRVSWNDIITRTFQATVKIRLIYIISKFVGKLINSEEICHMGVVGYTNLCKETIICVAFLRGTDKNLSWASVI